MTTRGLAEIAPAHSDSDLERYLGFTFEHLATDGVVVRIAPNPAARADGRENQVDERALVAVADHCMGVAIYAALDQKAPLATVDLKFERIRPLADGDVFLRATAFVTGSQLAFVSAWVDHGDSAVPIGHISARFIIGAWPGGGASEFPPALKNEIDMAGIDNFAGFAGLPAGASASSRFALAPLERTVGARAVPAFHGGVVAGALMTAATTMAHEMRGSDIIRVNSAFDYLRVALATAPLDVHAECVSSGRKTMRIKATAHQGEAQRPVAQALLLFEIGSR